MASYLPNPRPRSRSRSPYRAPPASWPPPGAGPAGRPGSWAEYAPGADAPRGEWDVYERDRSYYDRGQYDYGRRGRSRSPPIDDGNRKRRRSPSPYGADRYEPRPRYADDYDAHTRGGYGYNRSRYPAGRAPQNPYELDYPASLRQYAEWFRYHYPDQAAEEDKADRQAEAEAGDGSRPRNGIRSRWEKYKKEFAASQLQTMFDHHRKSPWFAEKYDPAPEFAYLRARIRKEGWRGRLAAFVQDLASGRFDPALDAYDDEPEPTLIPNDASRNEIDGPDDKPKIEATQDEEMKDVKKEPEPVPAPVKEEKNGPKDEDDGGIAPTDESMKMEEDDHEQDDADKPDGASVNGKGAGSRVIRSDEIAVDAEGNQVMIRTIPPDIGRTKLEKHGNFQAMPGYVYLALGDPLQKRNFYRAGWLKFREDTDMTTVMRELNEKKIDGFKLHVIHNTQPFRNKVRYTPEAASRPERIFADLANVRALAAKLDADYRHHRRLPARPADAGEDWEKSAMEEWASKKEGEGAETEDIKMEGAEGEEEDPLPIESGAEAVEKRVEIVMMDLKEAGKVDEADEKAYELKKNTVALDLYLAYLRNAYHTCYYCAIVTDHLEEFQRKCISHVRRPLTYAMRLDLEREEQKKREKAEKEREEKELADKVKDEQDMEADGQAKDRAEGEEQKEESKKESVKQDKLAEAKDWKRNDERWIEWLDSKVALLLKRDEVDPREYGGKAYEEELSKVAEPHIKQEDEGKFRCKTCTKLFKAVAFVEKHIANKHSELLHALDELPYFNNFALDPHHIQPLAHPPPQSSQQQPAQAYGAPYPPPGDYARGGPGGYYPPPYGGYGGPPPPAYGGYWGGDPYAYPYGAPPFNAPPSGKRLGDRIGGYAPGYGEDLPPAPPGAGLPPKPEHGGAGEERRRGGQRRRTGDLPPPPPPPDAKEDPRAAAGRKLSYHDMDSVAEGDVELQY
ncbi:unnamed protein product [Peniophora sp. CBMAI 1063]|nr:unnamed protein product [Peniophora sp. CBMAI 1063]